MQHRFFSSITLVLVILLSFSACKTTRVVYHPVPAKPSVHRMPPGQAKKVYGHQSARAFAPGQQKKVVHSPKGQKPVKGKTMVKSKGKK